MNDPLEMREDPRKTEMKGGTSMKGTLIGKEAVSSDSNVTIPLYEYNILVKKEQILTDICAVASGDKLDYCYSSETSKIIDTLLGIERKEKAD